MAAHSSSTSAFEEAVLERRVLAAHSNEKPKRAKVNKVLIATDSTEAHRAPSTARTAKSRGRPEQRERETSKRHERRPNQ